MAQLPLLRAKYTATVDYITKMRREAVSVSGSCGFHHGIHVS